MRWGWRLVLGLALWCAPSADAWAQKRVALVIGNSAYQHAARLANPSSDATAIAKLFKDIGFEVVDVRRDLVGTDLRRAIREFSQQARGADIAIVFYAGHGIELNGTNYLVPTDGKLEQDFDVEDETVPLDRLLAAVEGAKRLRLVVLDACRDNPFVKKMKRTVATRAIGQGLAKVEPASSDTLIAFAAKAGSIANDGEGPHSPFTTALLKHLPSPAVDVRLVFGRVRDDVLASTRGKQEPFMYGSLGGSDVALVAAPAAPQIPSAADVRRDYEIAERVGTLEAWDLFIGQYPTGFYANLARAQRAKLLEAAARQQTLQEAERKRQETERAIAEAERRKAEKDARRRREEEERQAKPAGAERQGVEREKAEHARAERERAEREALARAEEERKARAAEAERQRVEREKAERDKAEREARARAEEERKEKAAEAERQRVERERAERAKAEREKAEREARARAEEERQAKAAEAERQRIEREKAGREEAEREKVAREAHARAEEERQARAAEAERLRIEREKVEREELARIELEKAQREELVRIERERAERERARREEIARAEEERQRRAHEQAEREKSAEAEPPKSQVAMLPPASEPAAQPRPPPLPRGELVEAIKKELKRVGCYAGKMNEAWGDATLTRSIKQFVKYAKFSGAAEEPSSDFLEAVRGGEPGICPLECAPREGEKNGRCVAKTCPVGEVMRSNGRCVGKTKVHIEEKVRPRRIVKRPDNGHRGSRCFEHGGKVYC